MTAGCAILPAHWRTASRTSSALPSRSTKRDARCSPSGAAIAARLAAGTVWVNHHLGSEADVPFGGFKESGLGREHGVMGVQSYMEAEVINLPVATAP